MTNTPEISNGFASQGHCESTKHTTALIDRSEASGSGATAARTASTWPDEDVIDIRARSGDAPIVERDHRFWELTLEESSEPFFAYRASAPSARRLRIIADRENETTEMAAPFSSYLIRAVSSRSAASLYGTRIGRTFAIAASRLSERAAGPSTARSSGTGSGPARCSAVRVLERRTGTCERDRSSEPKICLKPVVPVPLWLALPAYAVYVALWVAVIVSAIAIGAVIVIGYGLASLIRRRQA